MLSILELPKQFQPKTSIKYPPFKNGRYMEEYFYDFYQEELKKQENQGELKDTERELKRSNPNGKDREELIVYIPVFWTNIQNHPGFTKNKYNLSLILSDKLLAFEKKTQRYIKKYFTIVQHDDGIQMDIPNKILDNLIIFGACTGDIPLPLIYEDTTDTLNKSFWSKTSKEFLATFIGSETHPVRKIMIDKLRGNADSPDKLRINAGSPDKLRGNGQSPKIGLQSAKSWTNSVSDSAADKFLDMTLKSEFCLAPRGYGRSSFRYFEAIQLGVIPVYIWDDIEWLPYKDILNYDEFSVSINIKDINKLEGILESISSTEIHSSMMNKLIDVKLKKYFTLEFMGCYILYRMGVNKLNV